MCLSHDQVLFGGQQHRHRFQELRWCFHLESVEHIAPSEVARTSMIYPCCCKALGAPTQRLKQCICVASAVLLHLSMHASHALFVNTADGILINSHIAWRRQVASALIHHKSTLFTQVFNNLVMLSVTAIWAVVQVCNIWLRLTHFNRKFWACACGCNKGRNT